jgi:hypothetical protein
MAKKKGNKTGGNNIMAVMQTISKKKKKGGGGGAGAWVQVPVAASAKPVKIKGTQIKQVKGGGFVRVVTEDGKEFPIEATKGVYKYLRSIGQEVVEPGKQQNQPKKAMKKQKKRKERTPEEEEVAQAKASERHQASIEKDGRVVVGDDYIDGEIVRRGGRFMWVKPDNPNSIPANVRGKLKKMNDEFRAKGGEGKKAFLGGETANVVFVWLADLGEQIEIKPETKVKFKLYTDNKGVGGCEVVAA